MDNYEFEMTFQMLKGIFTHCALMPLQEFRDQCVRYESVGCFTMAPKDWVSGAEGVAMMKEMATLALAIKAFAVKHDAKVKAAQAST